MGQISLGAKLAENLLVMSGSFIFKRSLKNSLILIQPSSTVQRQLLV